MAVEASGLSAANAVPRSSITSTFKAFSALGLFTVTCSRQPHAPEGPSAGSPGESGWAGERAGERAVGKRFEQGSGETDRMAEWGNLRRTVATMPSCSTSTVVSSGISVESGRRPQAAAGPASACGRSSGAPALSQERAARPAMLGKVGHLQHRHVQAARTGCDYPRVRANSLPFNLGNFVYF